MSLIQPQAIADHAPTSGSRFSTPSSEEFLTTQQLASALHISRRTIEGWRVTADGPPFIRAGSRRVIYRWGSVLDWLASREVISTSEETFPNISVE